MPPTKKNLRAGAVAALVLLTAACSAPTEASRPEPTLLTLYIGDVRINKSSSLALLPGTELTFSARLTDGGGRVVTGLNPRILSRNTNALTIDNDGVLRVVGRGASWIVGSITTPGGAALSDSTFVNVVCTVAAQPAIFLTVVDSLTGLSSNLKSIDITITSGLARDTVFVASLAPGSPPFSIGLAYERPGKYDLTVTADGEQTWTRSAVAVTTDLCHVVTVPITARLIPR